MFSLLYVFSKYSNNATGFWVGCCPLPSPHCKLLNTCWVVPKSSIPISLLLQNYFSSFCTCFVVQYFFFIVSFFIFFFPFFFLGLGKWVVFHKIPTNIFMPWHNFRLFATRGWLGLFSFPQIHSYLNILGLLITSALVKVVKRLLINAPFGLSKVINHFFPKVCQNWNYSVPFTSGCSIRQIG